MCFFQKLLIGIFLIFTGLMGVVTFYAFSRTSGFTRQDMAEAQFIRQKAAVERKSLDEISVHEKKLYE